MSFIRPEAAEALRRYQDVLLGAAVSLFGLWVWVSFLGFFRWLAVPLIALGLFAAWMGWRRAQVKSGRDGPGVVEITERRLSYFGPFGGDRISLDAVTRIEIETTELGSYANNMFWLFHHDGGILRVPAAAKGTDALFDMLASFTGANYDAVIRASAATSRDKFLIWQKRA